MSRRVLCRQKFLETEREEGRPIFLRCKTGFGEKVCCTDNADRRVEDDWIAISMTHGSYGT